LSKRFHGLPEVFVACSMRRHDEGGDELVSAHLSTPAITCSMSERVQKAHDREGRPDRKLLLRQPKKQSFFVL
jgi:hypothetical protein